jgi:hypothetical protein
LLALENKNKKMGQLYEGKYAADVVVEFWVSKNEGKNN